MADEALLAPWTGPHGGFPRFDRVRVADFKPSLLAAMDLHRAEIAAIAGSPEPPAFDNTIAALERAGRPFGRAVAVFGVYTSTMADAEVRQIEQDMAPVFAAFADEVVQNAPLFARIQAVHAGRHAAGLTAEQLRLVEVLYRSFERQGAALAAADKARLAEINGQLATLYTRFSQNVLADEEGQALELTGEAELAGLPEPLCAAAREAAAARGETGWRIANTRSAMEPLLVYSTRRDLRERGWRMWVSRGEHPGDHDNRPLIGEILALRAEKARLLGYSSHAHWIIDDNMARTPDAAMALLRGVWTAAVARAREEIADMQAIADAEHAGITIAPWDYRFYAEKVRKARYDLDDNEVKPYLQLDRMRDAMMWMAGELYGLAFHRLDGVPVCHPDVAVYEVTRDGRSAGLWYFDPYARDGKHSGAWMSEYRTQEAVADPVSPIVSNNANFMKASGAVLISWDDARTMFHEFGHALHGLCSAVHYPTLAGTSVKRDFVEFPSQLHEHWLATPEVLGRFARHYQTGAPIPAELVAKIQRARHFNQGFATVEYLASAIYDLQIHTAPGDPRIDPIDFERRVMAEIGCPPEIVMRHRPTQFGHIFASDGYSAGYYAYLWADTLVADAAEAFAQAGSFYDPAIARRLFESVMRVGNSIAPEQAFRAFRGRDVDTNALMRDRGFPVM
ncbi:MAG TPA: M3 family metallopeptidase [Kofleriaceae bacterium]|jgi:peptidyl-dipeptidase Dcp|nr:M3 family metallopeptidase [Kofleriaceae bacterium]